ncbi:glycosyltransferase [Hymenobacter terrestris]|uniref:Glycosyl transferase family 28 C-terminal domain-containing protein n=1 Tax=Hymenobacter terrestris TaxID=2748310 RepID=A0ABX2Q6C3_9BACT|nr:glycosyltransferase [Hymenobacter terrestris]NVO86109.1 hypothetical protein [Hymenobacter terrestris]
MIFVSVGTANQGFDRLLRECDQIAYRIGLPFFAQIGSSSFKPLHMPYQAWLSRDEMQYYYQNATAFIVHGGFGTLSEILKLGKPIFVVARLFEEGEAGNNNQTDLAVKLHSLGLIYYIEHLPHLEAAIVQRETYLFRQNDLLTTIPTLIQEYVGQLIHHK